MIIVPILIIAVIAELIIIIKPNNELKGNQVKQSSIEDIMLGDAGILFDSDNVSYDNSVSGLTSSTVQDVIDELYTYVASDSYWVSKYLEMSDIPQYYAWDEDPTYATSRGNHDVCLAKWEDEQLGVCIYRDGEEYCFQYNNWLSEVKHLQEVFSGANDSC